MNNIVLIDETLDINSTSNYHLSIQAGKNGFSFCVLDGNYNKYIAFKHFVFETEYNFPEDYANKLKSIFHKDELLCKEYKSSRFINISNRTTVIPSIYSKESDNKKYFEFNQDINDIDELHINKIDMGSNTLNILFTVSNYVAIDILNIHPNMKFCSQTTPFIKQAINKSKKETSRNKVFAYIYPSFFDLAVTKAGQLLLYNNFRYFDSSDLVYFLLGVYKQLGLSNLEDELIIGGIINKNSEELNILQQYINRVKLDKLNEDYTYSYTFNELQPNSFSNLFNLHSCEL